jgi:hypothetical protein
MTAMRVYYFTEARWALDDMKRRRVKVCRFSALNDPFELFAGVMADRQGRFKMREWAARIDEQYGLLCFSEDWHDPLMWSHYGDRHRGICLGFDAANDILTGINYSPKRLLLVSHGGSLTQQTENLLLTTKFARWEYEKERRMRVLLREVVRDGEDYFRPLDQALRLVQVIAGARCAESNNTIDAALGNWARGVEVIKARLAFKTFLVVRNRQGFRA